MKTKTVRKLQKGGGAGRGGDPRDFGFSASAAQASRSSRAPQSSPRPKARDAVKAQQFVESQGGDDNGSAAAIQQGIAAIAAASGDGGKRVFAQTPMFNAAGNVVGTYGGQPEIPSLPMTPFIINEIMGTSAEPLLPPPRSAPQAPQGLFGRSAPGSFAFSETSSMQPFDMFEDPLMVPGVSSFNAYDAAMPTPVPTTSVPALGVAPSVDTTTPTAPTPVQAAFTSPSLSGIEPFDPAAGSVFLPGSQVPFMLGGNLRTRGTTVPTAGNAPFVDTTTPPVPTPVEGMFAPPNLYGIEPPIPPGGMLPVTKRSRRMDQPPSRSALTALFPQEVGTAPTANISSVPSPQGTFTSPSLSGSAVAQSDMIVPMMDQPPSRSALMALRPQEVGTAPSVNTRSAPFPVAAPAPQPNITREAIANDIAESAASAERPSFNPLDFTMVGMAKRLIDSLAGGGGGGSLGSTRPETRPSVMNVMRGEGDDAQMYMAATRDMPRFGISAGDEMLPPDYSPFSLRGFTSSDPANVMRNIQGSERMARAFPDNSGSEDAAPVAPIAPPIDTGAMPTDRPAWWPPYLPWPPAPPSAAPMPTYRPPPVAPVMPGQQYSTSYSGLQGAISGAGNPLMMGIGGMIRRS
jgi:hypothetical protein